MSAITLSQAIATVEAELELAERQAGTYADDPRNWHQKYKTALGVACRNLSIATGMRSTDKWDGARVSLLGITASSTSGLSGALRNWLKAARQREAQQ